MIPQHHWVGKLLGFDFEVEYKPSSRNIVADALSRRDIDSATTFLLGALQFTFIDRLRQANAAGCDAPKISNLNYALKCPDRKFIRRKTLTLSVSPSH
jgi:hypothetical protein